MHMMQTQPPYASNLVIIATTSSFLDVPLLAD